MSIEITKLKKGESLSITQYYEVITVDPKTNEMTVKSSDGIQIRVGGKELIQRFTSASQAQKTEKLGKVDMAEKLMSAGDKVFTVVFEKQDGQERTLVGHLVSSEGPLGRSNVVDLEVPTGQHNIRQVDHRTIKSLILNGTKYVAK